jgi:hypothetical protein
MTRVIVEVSGGVVQAVYCDDAKVQVDLIDWDNKDDESREQNEQLEEQTKEMKEVF